MTLRKFLKRSRRNPYRVSCPAVDSGGRNKTPIGPRRPQGSIHVGSDGIRFLQAAGPRPEECANPRLRSAANALLTLTFAGMQGQTGANLSQRQTCLRAGQQTKNLLVPLDQIIPAAPIWHEIRPAEAHCHAVAAFFDLGAGQPGGGRQIRHIDRPAAPLLDNCRADRRCGRSAGCKASARAAQTDRPGSTQGAAGPLRSPPSARRKPHDRSGRSPLSGRDGTGRSRAPPGLPEAGGALHPARFEPTSNGQDNA